MKKRLIEFLAHLGIGQTKFEEKVGLSRGMINKIKGDMSVKSLNKIAKAYPELNIAWLQTGVGEMLNTNAPHDETASLESDFSKIADACQRAVATAETLAESNSKLVDDNSKVLSLIVESIARLEEKIDKKGALSESRGVL